MRNIIKESGRSILEMLAVLAIIALLTLGGLAGYSYLVQKQRQQESVKEVAQLVMGIRTAGLPRQYDVGETIPAGQVLKGPKMVDGNQVIQLPDDEESYAVVTNLSNGAFALNLQVKPGTCAEILKAFENEDFVMFDAMDDVNASQAANAAKNWVQGRRDGIRSKGAEYTVNNALVRACKTGSGNGAHLTGRASIVFDCAQGSATYGYLYDVLCSGCPAGEIHGLNGGCCDPNGEDTCGLYCGCPANTMCNKAKGQCVECSTYASAGVGNAQCKNVYPKVWQKHVCDGDKEKCVECVGDSDCQDSRADFNAPLPSEGAYYCVDQKCVECNTNYNGQQPAGDVVPCQNVNKPLCDNGICQQCPDGQEWSADLGECVCLSGKVKTKTGECALCVDDAESYSTDTGCNQGSFAGKPICADPGKRSVDYARGETGEAGTTCYECMTDAHCVNSTKGNVCNTKTHSCVACNGAWDPETNTCRHCQDNLKDDGFDKGCAESGDLGEAERLCKPSGDNNGNGTKAFGDKCYVCRNNHYSESDKGTRDDGCSDDAKLCEAGDGHYGEECKTCINDQEDDEKVDTGCSTANPICQNESGTLAKNAYGTKCTNNKCSSGVWNDNDGTCVACYDSASGGETDAGCGGSKPICVTPNWKNDGLMKESGTSCTECIDDKTGAETDAGCGGSGEWKGKPICAAGENKGSGKKSGSSCVECMVNSDCKDSKKPYCDTNAYKCVSCTTVSKLRGLNPLRPYYVNKFVGQDGCYVCTDTQTGSKKDNGCSDKEPVCQSGTNDGKGKGGNSCKDPCAGTDQCIDAAGVAGSKGACIKVSSFDDIKRGTNGNCECLDSVGSVGVNDIGHSYQPKDGWDKTCSRRQSKRRLIYKIPVKFYCERYMHVSDNAVADDYVVKSKPAGIGETSPAVLDKSWKTHDDNSIKPKVSSEKLPKGKSTAYLITSDRWLRETGFKGYFYFTTKKKGTGSKGKLKVDIAWHGDSKLSSPIGNWVEKTGEKGCGSSGSSGSTCFYASGNAEWAHNCGYPSGRVHGTHCFTKAWAASNTPGASCSISSDKHTVTVKNGRCNADFYEGRNCN